MPCGGSVGSSASLVPVPVGARTGIEVIGRVLADPQSAVPELIRHTASQLLEEIRLLEARIAQAERQLSLAARQSPACTLLLSITRHWTAQRHSLGGSHLGRRDALPRRTPLLQLVRSNAPRIQLGRQPLPGAHLQERRPARWPISSRASVMRRCAITNRLTRQPGWAGRRVARALRCQTDKPAENAQHAHHAKASIDSPLATR